MVETQESRRIYGVNSHSAVLNAFVDQARKQMDIALEVAALVSGKHSIKEQLAAKPIPGDKPNRINNNRETR